MPPDARVRSELVLTDFLTGLARRLQVVDAVRATRAALLAAAGAILGAAALGYRSTGVWIAITLAAAATAAAMLWRASERWSPGAVASLAERGIPESHNVIFTARELLGSAVESAPWMQRRVVERAASIVERASVPALVPVGRDIFWLGIAAIALAAIAFGMPQRVARLRSATPHADRATARRRDCHVATLHRRGLADPVGSRFSRGDSGRPDHARAQRRRCMDRQIWRAPAAVHARHRDRS